MTHISTDVIKLYSQCSHVYKYSFIILYRWFKATQGQPQEQSVQRRAVGMWKHLKPQEQSVQKRAVGMWKHLRPREESVMRLILAF